MVNIPFELFISFVSISVVLTLFGIMKSIPVLLVAGGLFIITMTVLTDNIIMGKVPASSTTSGSTTTYVMVDNLFAFTQWHKILFSFFGAISMLSAGIVVYKR